MQRSDTPHINLKNIIQKDTQSEPLAALAFSHLLRWFACSDHVVTSCMISLS